MTAAMFTSAPTGMGKQTHTDDICTGMVVLEKEMRSDSHQDPDTPVESAPSVVVLFYKEEKKRVSEG